LSYTGRRVVALPLGVYCIAAPRLNERRLRDVGGDAQLPETAADPLLAPAVEMALVGDVSTGERGVVKQSVPGEPLEHDSHRGRGMALPQQTFAELVAAAGAMTEQADGVAERLLGRGRGA